jgi:hypothetical protein
MAMPLMRQSVRLLAAVAVGAAASGCGLTGPTRLDAYTLVRVNGVPLPYTFSRSRGILDNRIYESRWTDGVVVIFAGGRLIFDATNDVLVDGLPSPSLPPYHSYQNGDYSRADTTLIFPPYFIGRTTNAGRTLLLTDQTGGYDQATFEFQRR